MRIFIEVAEHQGAFAVLVHMELAHVTAITKFVSPPTSALEIEEKKFYYVENLFHSRIPFFKWLLIIIKINERKRIDDRV